MKLRPQDPSQKGRLLVLAAAILWSSSGFFTKVIDLPPIAIAGYRTLFAALFLLPFLGKTRRTFRPAMLGMVVCFALMNVCFICSMVFTSAANAIFLEYTAPFWMVVVGRVWLKERIERANVIALAGGMLGIFVLVSGSWSLDPLGITLGVFSGILFAGVSLFLRFLRDEDALWLTFINMAVSALLVLVPLAIFRPEWLMASIPHLKMAALFGIIQTAIPYLIYCQGMARITAQEAGLIALLEPVINPLWAWFAVREVPHRSTLIGGALILFSIGARSFHRMRKSYRAAPRPE